MSICPSCNVKPLKRDFKFCYECRDKGKLSVPKVLIDCKECGKNKHDPRWPCCHSCGNKKPDLDVIMCGCERQKHHIKFNMCFICSSEKDILMFEGKRLYSGVYITVELRNDRYYYTTNLHISNPPSLAGYRMIDNHLHFYSADLITKITMDRIIARFREPPPNI